MKGRQPSKKWHRTRRYGVETFRRTMLAHQLEVERLADGWYCRRDGGPEGKPYPDAWTACKRAERWAAEVE